MKTDSLNNNNRKCQFQLKQSNLRPERAGSGWNLQSINRLPDEFQIVSLKSVAELLDTTRSSARRWLREAGIKPIALGRGAKGAIRYRWQDIEEWLKSREYVE